MTQSSDWEKFKQDSQGYAESIAKSARPWDFLNPNTEYASKEEASSRLDICKSCPFLIKATVQCKKCGCFMKAKTKLKQATCPEGHW
jgi:hypothetical protein